MKTLCIKQQVQVQGGQPQTLIEWIKYYFSTAHLKTNPKLNPLSAASLSMPYNQ